MKIKHNLIGKRFGKWLVTDKAPTTRNKKGISICKWCVTCDCGKKKQIRTVNLTRGVSASCGCSKSEWHKAHSGDKSPTWKRGYIHDDSGYKLIRNPKHHRAKSNGYVREHIVVMESLLGRRLLPHEQVHHLNGVKDDNRKENLELWSKSQPSGQRIIDKINWAKEILELYKNYEEIYSDKGPPRVG